MDSLALVKTIITEKNNGQTMNNCMTLLMTPNILNFQSFIILYPRLQIQTFHLTVEFIFSRNILPGYFSVMFYFQFKVLTKLFI